MEGKGGEGKRLSTITLSTNTKKMMREWSKLRYPGERKSFDQIIQILLEESYQKNPDPLRWNLSAMEKEILKLIEKEVGTSRDITDKLGKKKIKTTQRNVQMVLEALRRKGLIGRKKKNWREYQYYVLLKKRE